MNIAFPAFFILILVAPGPLLLMGYARGRWGEYFEIKGLSSQLLFSVIIAIVFHGLWIIISNILPGPDVQPNIVLQLIVNPNDVDYKIATSRLGCVAIYFISLYGFSFLSGFLLRRIVEKFDLDVKWSWLCPYSEMYHFLVAERAIKRLPNRWWKDKLKIFFPDMDDIEEDEVDFFKKFMQPFVKTRIASVVDFAGKAYLCIGDLLTAKVTKSGEVDYLIVEKAYRRIFDEDRVEDGEPDSFKSIDNDDRFYRIRGDRLILFSKDMITINVEHVIDINHLLPTEE